MITRSIKINRRPEEVFAYLGPARTPRRVAAGDHQRPGPDGGPGGRRDASLREAQDGRARAGLVPKSPSTIRRGGHRFGVRGAPCAPFGTVTVEPIGDGLSKPGDHRVQACGPRPREADRAPGQQAGGRADRQQSAGAQGEAGERGRERAPSGLELGLDPDGFAAQRPQRVALRICCALSSGKSSPSSCRPTNAGGRRNRAGGWHHCPTWDWRHIPDLYSAKAGYPGMNLQIAATLEGRLAAVGLIPVHGARHDAHAFAASGLAAQLATISTARPGLRRSRGHRDRPHQTSSRWRAGHQPSRVQHRVQQNPRRRRTRHRPPQDMAHAQRGRRPIPSTNRKVPKHAQSRHRTLLLCGL